MTDKDANNAANPFSSAVDQMHATAKWIIGIFGAIGAVLVAGTQLSSMGQLALGDVRLWVTVSAFAIGLTCGGVIVRYAAKVLTEGHVTRERLKRPHQQNDCLHISEYASGFGIEQLLTEYDADIAARNALFAKDRTGTLLGAEIHQLKELNARIEYLGSVVQQLAAAAYYNEVCKLFKTAIKTMFIAGTIGTWAIGVFAWAVNPPTAAETTPSPAPSASASTSQQ